MSSTLITAFLPAVPLALERTTSVHQTSSQRPASFRPSRSPIRASTAADERLDSRGFVVPQPGDVVLYAGRWAGEQNAGVVDSVRDAQQRVIVDVQEMRRLSNDLFAVQAARNRKLRWFDVAQIRVARDAVYVPGQDAYRIPNVPDGYAYVKPMDDEARERAAVEYRKLKSNLLNTTLTIAAAGTLLSAALFGKNLATAYTCGAAASVAYLVMLQGSVDALGSPTFFSRFLSFRFALLPLPFVLLAFSNGARSPSDMLGILDRRQAIAIVLGLLTYKVPFLARTFNEFVDSLSRIEIGKTGMIGTVAALAARQIKRLQQDADDATQTETLISKPVFVFAGPSGVGKSTLIHKLMDEFPLKFQYSVSHTTREPRSNELDGEDYIFITHQEFEDMIKSNRFVEYAHVHGQYYGTSYDAVKAVLEKQTFCVLDLDIQGVEALRNKADLSWQPIFVWIAPPNVSALEDRLKNRGTETSQTMKTRLTTAMREMSFAATSNIFDLTIINDNLDEAYAQLHKFIEYQTKPFS
ncbi:unnamed protein product [Agarophyton chilense]